MKCSDDTMKAWAGLLLGVQRWADWSLNVWKCEGRTDKQWRCEKIYPVIKQTQLQQNIINDYINLTEWKIWIRRFYSFLSEVCIPHPVGVSG